MPPSASKASPLPVESWPVERPVPYARNARKIPASAIAKVAASIKEYGWRQPIVVDDEGVIIAGHTRLLAAQRLGHKVVPVHVAKGLTKEQAAAFRLMDNRSHEGTGWDDELLALELKALADADVMLEAAGFTDQDLTKLLAAQEQADAEKALGAPEVEIGAELYEQHNYVVLYFDNELDWQAAQQTLGLKAETDELGDRVRKADGSPGRMGTGKVIRGADILRRLNEA